MEMRGEDEEKTAPTMVYFSGNFTFNTQEEIDIEEQEAESGSIPTRQLRYAAVSGNGEN